MEETIKSLMNIAEDELKSAKLLYAKGIYHKSLFLFQQANEKAYKASALMTDQIGLKDLTKVGHDFIRLLKKGEESMNIESKEKALALVKKPYNLEEDLSSEDISNAINSANRGDFFSLSEEEIKDHIKGITRFRRASKQMLDKTNLIELANSSDKISPESKNGFIEYMDSPDAEAGLLNIQKTIYQMYVFYIVGLITSPHSEQTRYPFGEGKNIKCPTKIYTQDLPLIKYQKRLMNLCGASIIDVKAVLN